jgi:phosphoenolpyruvate carboxykinase (GTP)
LCQPQRVHFCNGSDEEWQQLVNGMVDKGLLVPLKREKSYWCHSDPQDVARVEECTFICSQKKEDAGPTNNWRDPAEVKKEMQALYRGCMRGRTLYVVPFCMGPLDSPYSIVGVEITDSPYVVCNMKLMTHMGKEALRVLEKKKSFVPCLHSVGKPLEAGEADVPWPCNPQKRLIAHFPEERLIWSFGSGYGGNSLLGKKCLALRIASVMARDEGWLAEHMLILGVTNPEGVKKYFTAAFPSACGKTNLAMLKSELPGWTFECVGDDIAWMHFNEEGELMAINPESGFFGVAPGTSYASNPNAMETIRSHTLFTNTALTPDRDVWWEGMTPTPPGHLIDWEGKPWTPDCDRKAAHPNARFTVACSQCPVIDPHYLAPQGVPISGIIFGGRRAALMPLVVESFDWTHGVLLGASLSSERTAAAAGAIGEVRHDPFAMLPFCGYHMGDYFSHWLSMAQKSPRLPKIFAVNWFRKDASGQFVWPGYGENARVIKWIFERVDGRAAAIKKPIGFIPAEGALDLSGLSIARNALFAIDPAEWRREVADLKTYFKGFGERFPKPLNDQLATWD